MITDEQRIDWLEEHATLHNGKWSFEFEAEQTISYFRDALDAEIERQQANENSAYERTTWDGVNEE